MHLHHWIYRYLQPWLDMVASIATIVAACFAASGLNTWSEQMHATNDIDLARRLDAAAIGLRNELISSRSPFSLTDKNEAKARLQKNSERVIVAYKSLEHLSREAEWMWDKSAKEFTDKLVRIGVNYAVLVGKYNLETTTDDSKIELLPNLFMQLEGKDEFAEDLQAAVKNIQEYLIPKMHREQRVGCYDRFKRKMLLK